MSHWAMGWAQRQKLGDPVAKAVLHAMCYVLRDESLAVFVSIPTLCEYTEYDERTVRKAIARLAELGALLDTGMKKNNVTVWRIPGYENWLRRQIESPDNNGRASETDARALAQVAELTKEKKVNPGSNHKPPQKGEGSAQAPSSLQSSPPTFAPEGGQALPNVSPNLLGDLNRSSDARASDPYGLAPATETPESKAAPDPEGFNREAVYATWWRQALSEILGAAIALEIVPFGTKSLSDVDAAIAKLELDAPVKVAALVDSLAAFGTAQELHAWPRLSYSRRQEVDRDIRTRVNRALKDYAPPTAANRPPRREVAA